jgi:flagellar motor switch protein FliN/FliY
MASNNISATMVFYLPTLISTKFEYFMLGGIGELKSSLDDETLDAAKEIVSTIGGSLGTTINSQDFDDLSGVSFSQTEASILNTDEIEDSSNLYKIDILFNEDNLEFYISFDDALATHMGKIISGEEIDTDEEEENLSSGGAASVLSLLGAESTENLKLLFNVKLKFSVRLGTKTFLLKDIVNWDIGHIIELEQMVNEPLDILINGTKVGEGEAVIVEGRFGIKIRNIGDKQIEV